MLNVVTVSTCISGKFTFNKDITSKISYVKRLIREGSKLQKIGKRGKLKRPLLAKKGFYKVKVVERKKSIKTSFYYKSLVPLCPIFHL